MENKKRAYEVNFNSNLLFTGQGSKIHPMQNFQIQVGQILIYFTLPFAAIWTWINLKGSKPHYYDISSLFIWISRHALMQVAKLTSFRSAYKMSGSALLLLFITWIICLHISNCSYSNQPILLWGDNSVVHIYKFFRSFYLNLNHYFLMTLFVVYHSKLIINGLHQILYSFRTMKRQMMYLQNSKCQLSGLATNIFLGFITSTFSSGVIWMIDIIMYCLCLQ
jgi:hypothetical protein